MVSGGKVQVAPEDRRLGFVFQDIALFPHLTVAENVAFGLRRRAGPERRTTALAALDQLGLARFAEAYPHTLSGGQQQRVALARALAPDPKLMLLDEPFSGLDARLRDRLRDETLDPLKARGCAAVVVTHDPEEAMRMGDRLAVMSEGRIVQCGTPSELYRRPASAFVASFLGEVERFEGTVEGGARCHPARSGPGSGLASRQRRRRADPTRGRGRRKCDREWERPGARSRRAIARADIADPHGGGRHRRAPFFARRLAAGSWRTCIGAAGPPPRACVPARGARAQ